MLGNEHYIKEVLKELLIRTIFIGGYFLSDQLIDHSVRVRSFITALHYHSSSDWLALSDYSIRMI